MAQNDRQQELITALKGLEIDEGHLQRRAQERAGRKEAAEKELQRCQSLKNDTPSWWHFWQAAQQAYELEIERIAHQERIDQQTLQDMQAQREAWQKELDALVNSTAKQG